MQATPLVSVIVPTWKRPRLLLDRCLPSVVRQEYHNWELVVVSDGPDPVLGYALRNNQFDLSIAYAQLSEHDPNVLYGSRARIEGQKIANGQIIAHLDDDNSWRPEHLSLLVAKLQASGADFAYSQMIRHPGEDVIGIPPPGHGRIDTSLIVHRRELLEKANWTPHAERQDPDWELVSKWLEAGATWAYVPAVTVDYYTKDS